MFYPPFVLTLVHILHRTTCYTCCFFSSPSTVQDLEFNINSYLILYVSPFSEVFPHSILQSFFVFVFTRVAVSVALPIKTVHVAIQPPHSSLMLLESLLSRSTWSIWFRIRYPGHFMDVLSLKLGTFLSCCMLRRPCRYPTPSFFLYQLCYWSVC